MIPQLATALASGYSTKQVMQFLIRQFPQHADKIKQALKVGFTADQVVKFLGGGRKAVNQEYDGLTEHEQTRSKDIQRRENVNQGALKGVGMAALAGGTALAAPMAKAALQRAAPQLLGPGAVNGGTGIGLGQTGTSTSLSQPIQSNVPNQSSPQINASSSTSPILPNLPQQQNQPQPELNTINISEVLNKYPGFETKINDMLRAKVDPEKIVGYFKEFKPSEVKKLEKETGKPIDEIVLGYIDEKSKEPRKALSREETLGAFREGKIQREAEEQFLKQENPNVKPLDIEQAQEKPKIEKGSTVGSPQGIGEIKEIRNGKAIIEVDGKKHQVDEEELIESPLPEKDLADLYDELVSGIEKTTGKQVSRSVDWAGYDPNTNELAYKPHGSDKLYAYEDIDPEDVELLTSLLTQRKSTGENFIGAWSAGSESPIGAAMYQLIKKLQTARGGKGSEYKNKYETIYDALEPAKKAAKERHAERKKKAKKPRFD